MNESVSVIVDSRRSPHAALTPVAVSAVTVTDAFWQPRREANRTVTLPGQLRHCEATGRIRNFQRAAGKVDVPFEGIYFNDSDVYKWLEAAAWSLASHPDPAFDAQVDAVIADIADAQQPDGYLNSYFMFELAAERLTNLRDRHEIYCAGHLFQAAVAHFRATGKRTLLDVACKLADHLDHIFGDGKRPGACGHPEAEMALVELGRATGEARYIALARHMVAVRGQKPAICGGGAYWQDHLPYTQLTEVTGHAVRMLYLAAGATDLVLESGDSELTAAIDAQFASFTERRMHLTGGAGARWEGEAFGDDYELPSERAYTETCAAIASVMWAWRLLLRTGEAKYADLIEWTLYNAILPGLSLDGTHYFYQNPLADRGAHRRQEWFGCACCPPNLARLLAQLPGYAYAQRGNDIYVNLFLSGTARIGGTTVTVRSGLPWNGTVTITAEGDAERLLVRVPAWANGVATWQEVRLQNGTASVTLDLPMPVRKLYANPRVLATRGQVALARGPLVYCVEAVDHGGADVWELTVAPNAFFTPTERAELLGGVVVLSGEGQLLRGDGPLYGDRVSVGVPIQMTAVPYYAWANRKPGSMTVWLRELP